MQHQSAQRVLIFSCFASPASVCGWFFCRSSVFWPKPSWRLGHQCRRTCRPRSGSAGSCCHCLVRASFINWQMIWPCKAGKTNQICVLSKGQQGATPLKSGCRSLWENEPPAHLNTDLNTCDESAWALMTVFKVSSTQHDVCSVNKGQKAGDNLGRG